MLHITLNTEIEVLLLVVFEDLGSMPTGMLPLRDDPPTFLYIFLLHGTAVLNYFEHTDIEDRKLWL